MAVLVFLQIINWDENKSCEKIVIFEIFLMSLAFNLIFIIPSIGLSGYDSHFEYSVAKMISEHGWPIPENVPTVYQTRDYSEWPMLHIFTIILSTTTSANLFTVAKWVPPFFSSFVILYFYLLVRNVYSERKIALLASLGFSALFWHINFHSKFVRETFAYLLFFAILFIIMKKPTKKTQLIFVLLVMTLVSSHHFTSLIMILFLSFIIAANFFVPYLTKFNVLARFKNTLKNESRLFLALTSVLFVTVATMSYWMYVGEFTFRVFKIILNESFWMPEYQYATNYFVEGSPRMRFSTFGNIIFVVVFSLIVLHEIFRNGTYCKKAYCKKALDFTFLCWSIVLIGISWLSILIRSLTIIDFTRFIPFSYPFMLMCCAHALRNKRKLSSIIVLFILLQLLTVPPYIYDPSVSPEYEYGSYRKYFLPEEYSASTWFVAHADRSSKIAGDAGVFELIGSYQFDVEYKNERVVRIFRGDFEPLDNYGWLILRNEDFYYATVGRLRITEPITITTEIINRIHASHRMLKILDNGEMKIYKIQS